MAITLSTLRTLITTTRQHLSDLRTLIDHLQHTDHDVSAWFAGLMEDETFRLHPADHHARVLTNQTASIKADRVKAAGVALYLAERSTPDLAEAARIVNTTARRLPDPVSTFLARTGGKRIHLKDEAELLIQALDEQRRARFDRDLGQALPSVVLARYLDALEDTSAETGDESASVMRWVEGHIQAGRWAGVPMQADEANAVKALAKAIETVQAERIPPEVEEARALISEVQKVASRAQTLYKVRPINPAHQSGMQDVYENELRSLAEAQAEAEA